MSDEYDRLPENPLLHNTSIVKPGDLNAWQSAAWDEWYAAFGCVVCGGHFGDRYQAKNLLFPALANPDGDRDFYCPDLDQPAWVKPCDCPAPRQTSACEVSPW